MMEYLKESLERREFMKLMGPGLYFLFSMDDLLWGQRFRRSGGYPEDFNAYMRIAEDGSVTCFVGKVEMGQGIIASLAQMLAEELEVPYGSVKMVMGDTKLCPWDFGTNGSRSIKYFGPVLRTAGAEAREVLRELAAEYLQLPVERLIAKEGVVWDKSNPARKVTYGSLAKGKTIQRHLQKKPALKPPSAFSVCGKSLPRADFTDKVTGRAKFAGDIRLEGMLYGKVLRPPAHDAKLKAVDLSAVKEVPGARVLRDGDFIGVVHPLPDMAEKALACVKAEYERPE